MNRQHCHCSPAYGAMMHALPRDASQLKGMSEQDIFTKAMPWVNRVPPVSEFEFDTWTVKAVNPNPKGLGDLGDLAELAGLRSRLRRVAKKITSGVKKVAKKAVAVHKKVIKAAFSKKLAVPFAVALGAATGTLPLVLKAKALREKIIAAKKAAQAQTGQTDEQIEAEAEAEAQAQARAEEQQYQQAQAQQQEQARQQQQEQARQQAQAQQQSWQQAQQQYQPQNSFVEDRQPQSSPFSLQPMYSNPVQRLSQEETEEQPKIVGLSTAGIMENIKANPLPWGAGLAVAVYLITRRPAHQNQRAY